MLCCDPLFMLESKEHRAGNSSPTGSKHRNHLTLPDRGFTPVKINRQNVVHKIGRKVVLSQESLLSKRGCTLRSREKQSSAENKKHLSVLPGLIKDIWEHNAVLEENLLLHK